jgi:DNA-binding LacI/PurR family transcriptional regulator
VRNGIDVPGQVSLIGFDDIPEASHGLLELTTIRQDINKKAHVAVETLVRLITAGPDPRGPVMLEVDLVERDTVGPPPSTLIVRDAGSGSRWSMADDAGVAGGGAAT